jgi:hypothetical protein
MAVADEAVDEMRADEASPTGDKELQPASPPVCHRDLENPRHDGGSCARRPVGAQRLAVERFVERAAHPKAGFSQCCAHRAWVGQGGHCSEALVGGAGPLRAGRLPPRMDSTASLRFINELEATFPVASWRLSGVRVWPLMRGELWWRTNDDYRPLRTRVRAGNPVVRRAAQLWEWPADLARWTGAQLRRRDNRESLRRPAEAVLLGDGVSRTLIDGAWLDRHTDPFVDALDELGMRSLQLDLHRVYRVPTYRPSAQIQPVMDALWLRNRARRSRESVEGLDRYVDFLAEVRARGFDMASIRPAAVRRQAAYVRATADWFGRLLDRTGAQAGLLVDHGVVHMGFNLACSERGIPSIEIQHGVQIANARYAAWKAIPPGGYLELPSHFWCWGDAEAANIRAWSAGCERHQAIVGGNLWLRTWLDADAAIVRRYDAVLQDIAPRAAHGLEILVTLSTGYTHTDDLRTVRDAIADAPDDWRWWIRRHPTMGADEFDSALAFLGGSRARDTTRGEAGELPLYALLRRVDVHVSQVSSAGIEAQHFRVPSVMTDASAARLFAEQFSSGWMVRAASAEELNQAIASQVERRPGLPVPSDPRRLPSPAAVLGALVGTGSGERRAPA